MKKLFDADMQKGIWIGITAGVLSMISGWMFESTEDAILFYACFTFLISYKIMTDKDVE